MQPTDDSALLRDYCQNQSPDAFAELVTRHINLVYSVALRYVGNPHHAEEITQAVFIILAKKASSLRHDKALSSWLFQATHLTANNFIRSETRRHRREQEAYMQSISDPPETAVWKEIAPLLDTAVARLNEKDRRAIVLRFYEGRNLREIGTALGANEESAKKRVARALEKLRKYFFARGVDSPTAVIAGTISTNSVQVAPAGLAKAVSALALAKGAAASASTAALVEGTFKFITWTKMKGAIIAGACVLLEAGTTGIVITEMEAHSKPENTMPPFTVAGWCSSKFYSNPLDTNDFGTEEGTFLFSYSNGIWQVQFAYQDFQYPPGLKAYLAKNAISSQSLKGQMTDDKRIPGGMREIITFPPNPNEIKPPNLRPAASVTTNTFPVIGMHGLFLPWLSLCPNPELPLVGPHLINFFQPSRFAAHYITPDKTFLSELVITNDGTMHFINGEAIGTTNWPTPYQNGFVESIYEVLERTNCQGINFPLQTVLYQFCPQPNGKTRDDLFTVVTTRLTVQQIDVGSRNLSLAPVPKLMEALDYRPGFSNDLSMNYDVTDDKYVALTDTNLAKRVLYYERYVANRPVQKIFGQAIR